MTDDIAQRLRVTMPGVVKEDPFAGVYRALSPKELAEMFMNPHAPKTEAEHWAVREIEELRAEVSRLRGEVERLRADAERFRWLANQKRLHLYTDGGTWTRADGTTFRAWRVLAANGVGYPPAETLAEMVDTARKDQENGR